RPIPARFSAAPAGCVCRLTEGPFDHSQSGGERKMTCRTLKTLAAAALGTAILAGPAAAGGSLSVSYNPTNAQDALTLATALRLYALFEGVKNGGKISQNGM